MTALSQTNSPPPHSLEEDFRLLKDAVQAAGELAYSYFRRELAVQTKHDGTEVSEADLAVDATLKGTLLGGRPMAVGRD